MPLAMNLQYTPELKQLRVRAKIDELICKLRRNLGAEDFLRGQKIVLAHQVQSNSFRESYGMNFVPL